MAGYNPRFDPKFIKRIEESYNKEKANGTIHKSTPLPAYTEHILHLFEDSGKRRPYHWLNNRDHAVELLEKYKREKKSGETFKEWENARLEEEHRDYLQNPPEFKGYDDYGWADHNERFPRNPTFKFWRNNIAKPFPEGFDHNSDSVDNPRTPVTTSVFTDTSIPLILPPPSETLSFSEFPDPLPQVSEDRYTDTFNPLQTFPTHMTGKNMLHSKKKLHSKKNVHSNQKRGGSIRKHKHKKSCKHKKSRKYKRKTRN